MGIGTRRGAPTRLRLPRFLLARLDFHPSYPRVLLPRGMVEAAEVMEALLSMVPDLGH